MNTQNLLIKKTTDCYPNLQWWERQALFLQEKINESQKTNEQLNKEKQKDLKEHEKV